MSSNVAYKYIQASPQKYPAVLIFISATHFSKRSFKFLFARVSANVRCKRKKQTKIKTKQTEQDKMAGSFV